MSDTNDACCPDCGTDRSALQAQNANLRVEIAATREVHNAEIRVLLEQRMEAGQDVSPVLEILEREGFDIGELLIG